MSDHCHVKAVHARAWGLKPINTLIRINLDEDLQVSTSFQPNIPLTEATALTPPPHCNVAIIEVAGGPIRWTNDGTMPSETIGLTQQAGDKIVYVGPLTKFTAIETNPASPATMTVAFFFDPRFMGPVQV